MDYPLQIRLGSMIVRALDEGRFVFRDAQDASQVQMVDNANVPELIQFLYHWSAAAKQKIKLELVSDSAQHPGT